MRLYNAELLWSWLKILAALPVVLLLAYLSFKLSRRYLNNFRRGTYVSVLETVSLFNKSAVSVVKIGNKYLALGVSEHDISVICELSEEEINQLKAEESETVLKVNSLSDLKARMKDKMDRRQEKE